MIIDNTAALQFLLNDDIYLVKEDTGNLQTVAIPAPVAPAQPEPMAAIAAQVIAPEPVIAFNYLGKNQQQFLIICHYTAAIDDKHLAALTSTLQRKQLALDDVAILNMALHATATMHDIQKYFKPRRLLLLGDACLINGWDKFTLNQLQNDNDIKALYTYSFAEMMGDRDKTKAFWEQMKAL